MAKRATVSTITIRSARGERAQLRVSRAAPGERYIAGPLAVRRMRRSPQLGGVNQAAPLRTRAATQPEQLAASEWAVLCADARALDARRQALGCTLAALAQRIGLSATTIGRLLRVNATTPPPDAPSRQRARQRLAALRLALDAYQARPLLPTLPTSPSARGGAARSRLTRTAASATPAALATRPHAPTYRVLIVEDDPDVVAIYRLTLAEAAHDTGRAARYEVTVAPTAAACVAALRAAHASERTYDLLIMDLSLRDMRATRGGHSQATNGDDGEPVKRATDVVATLTSVAALLPRRRLVVSGMAPYHLKRARQALARLGAAYLPKPFDIETLLATVYALCAEDEASARGLTYFG